MHGEKEIGKKFLYTADVSNEEEFIMKCLFVDGVKQVSIREREIPTVSDKDVLVKIMARGICGTDLASYRSGKAMGFGHEMSGIICRTGENSSWKTGTRVFVCNLSQKLVNYAP